MVKPVLSHLLVKCVSSCDILSCPPPSSFWQTGMLVGVEKIRAQWHLMYSVELDVTGKGEGKEDVSLLFLLRQPCGSYLIITCSSGLMVQLWGSCLTPGWYVWEQGRNLSAAPCLAAFDILKDTGRVFRLQSGHHASVGRGSSMCFHLWNEWGSQHIKKWCIYAEPL